MADKFFVEGLTVSDILSLSDDQLRSLSRRDMSRAVRTVALAANKRVNRLLKQTTLKKGEFTEKKKSAGVATDALNWLYDKSGHKKANMKFGAKNKTRNELIKELSRAKQFMQMQTSTVKGAVDVRKEREKRIMGETREQAIKKFEKERKSQLKKAKTKKDKAKIESAYKKGIQSATSVFEQNVSNAYSNFRKFLEMQGLPNSPYKKFDDSEKIMKLIGMRTAEGANEKDILEQADKLFEESYIEAQQELIDSLEDDNFLDYDLDELDDILGL